MWGHISLYSVSYYVHFYMWSIILQMFVCVTCRIICIDNVVSHKKYTFMYYSVTFIDNVESHIIHVYYSVTFIDNVESHIIHFYVIVSHLLIMWCDISYNSILLCNIYYIFVFEATYIYVYICSDKLFIFLYVKPIVTDISYFNLSH